MRNLGLLCHFFDFISTLTLLLSFLSSFSFLFGIKSMFFYKSIFKTITVLSARFKCILSIFNHSIIFIPPLFMANDILTVHGFKPSFFVSSFLQKAIKIQLSRNIRLRPSSCLGLGLFLWLHQSSKRFIKPNSLIMSKILGTTWPLLKLWLLINPISHSLVIFAHKHGSNILILIQRFHPPILPLIQRTLSQTSWTYFGIRNYQPYFQPLIFSKIFFSVVFPYLNSYFAYIQSILTHFRKELVLHLTQF